MEDLEEIIKKAEKNLISAMKTTKWQKSFERSERQVKEIIKKLEQESKVDPKLLDEPATI